MTDEVKAATGARGLAAWIRLRLAAPWLRQFVSFGVVGAVGGAADIGTYLLALHFGAGLYPARAISYVAGATTTWGLNRAWTFRGRRSGARRGREWAAYLTVSLAGFAVNFGVYALTLELWPLAQTYPVLAVIVGALVGMSVNFTLSKYLVFKIVET